MVSPAIPPPPRPNLLLWPKLFHCSRRSKALALAPTGEMLEYDLTLTGVVAQRTIMTIEDQASEGINPFNLLADLGKRSVAALYGPVAGLLKSREKPEPPKEP
jgi:hypothetical protein